ncbi:hypothetical protein [Paraburkholderia aspalathi]|uniref:hypothetical protein n=1 Tax=Paraburkholderia aspalathi TaxID=1324617 RepID=UPI0038BD5AEB
MIRFETFCRNESEKAATKATSEFASAAAPVKAATPLATQHGLIEADLAQLAQPERDALTTHVTLSDALLAAVQRALTEGSATLPSGMAPFSVAALHDLGDTLDTRAATEESADDPAIRAKLQQEVEEIEARKWLGAIQSQVETQIDRLAESETLAKVFKSTHGSNHLEGFRAHAAVNYHAILQAVYRRTGRTRIGNTVC